MGLMFNGRLSGGAASNYLTTPDNFVYERVASTYLAPVTAGATDYALIDYIVPTTQTALYLYGVGSDQHDNSTYEWVVDTKNLAINGSARAGSIADPYIFPAPIRVTSRIRLLITNNNAVAYPNNGTEPSDAVPYEGVFFGRWE